MGKNQLVMERRLPAGITLVAEEGTSLSSGSLRLYALPYGCVDLYNYDPLNRRAAVGIMVSKEYRRQGYALAMLHALEELSTTHYRLHTLFADIAASNTASLALFRKAGYEECGHFKEWLLVNDKYVDSIRMQKVL
jgi:diamine N-acetyltransferase